MPPRSLWITLWANAAATPRETQAAVGLQLPIPRCDDNGVRSPCPLVAIQTAANLRSPVHTVAPLCHPPPAGARPATLFHMYPPHSLLATARVLASGVSPRPKATIGLSFRQRNARPRSALRPKAVPLTHAPFHTQPASQPTPTRLALDVLPAVTATIETSFTSTQHGGATAGTFWPGRLTVHQPFSCATVFGACHPLSGHSIPTAPCDSCASLRWIA